MSDKIEPTQYAFPHFDKRVDFQGEQHYRVFNGMLLRDWFAGQALAGILARMTFHQTTMASEAYRYADAMMEARKQ